MSSIDPDVPVGARTMWGKRRLPNGLWVCDGCGGVRGTTRAGRVSQCLCAGLVCNGCGTCRREPISEYYEPRDRQWWYVPIWVVMGHRCPGLDGRPPGSRWTHLQSDAAITPFRAAVTAEAWAELDDRLTRQELAAAAGRVVNPGLLYDRGRQTTDEERGLDIDIGAPKRDP